jgi:hypothetical protein
MKALKHGLGNILIVSFLMAGLGLRWLGALMVAAANYVETKSREPDRVRKLGSPQ